MTSDPTAPIVGEDEDEDEDAGGGAERAPDDTIGIALSGGGYRAMLFHAGAIVRMFECGLLAKAARISSVSGGSIVSAKLALEWPKLDSRAALFAQVIEPVRRLAGTSIDVSSVMFGALLPGTAGDRIAAAYDKHLFHGATLQDLPTAPVFVINATNVETGSLWRFSRRRARDWRVGEITAPRFALSTVVAASSAFPPVLSPLVLETRPSDFDVIERGVDPAFLHDVSLTDGGVYDNLGLETVFKRCRTLLVSNGGGALAPDPSPAGDWARHARRVLDIIHNQVSSVRVRQLIEVLEAPTGNPLHRRGAYWGIGADVASYRLRDGLPAPVARTRELAETPTRLTRIDPPWQERLINWGYAASDTAIRRWFPGGGPYPTPAYPYGGGV